MINMTTRIRSMALGLMMVVMPLVGGCGDNNMLTWTEDVKLLDGRVITVTQKRQYESVYTGSNHGTLPREFWLTFKLPEFGGEEITWHENLLPQVLNVYQGKLYVVGAVDTQVAFIRYGKPFPEYVAYRYEAGQWKRIPFNEIPVAIYDTNMWIDNEPENSARHVSLSDKLTEMKDDSIRDHYKKLSATYQMPH